MSALNQDQCRGSLVLSAYSWSIFPMKVQHLSPQHGTNGTKDHSTGPNRGKLRLPARPSWHLSGPTQISATKRSLALKDMEKNVTPGEFV